MSVDDYRRYKTTGRTTAGSYTAANQPPSSMSRFDMAYSGSRKGGGKSAFADTNDEEEDIEGLKQQIKQVKYDTLESTRNALNKLKETEDIGARTLDKLGQQTDQMINIEKQLDKTDIYADKAAEQTSELKKLNKSIFSLSNLNPLKSKKKKDTAKELAKLEEDYQRQQQAGGSASKYRVAPGDTSHRFKGNEDREQYMFEEEDQELEDEIDQNLDLMSDGLANLKNMGMAMNQEVNAQNQRLDRISEKTDKVAEKISVQTKKLEKF